MAFTTDTYIIKGMRQDDSDLLFNAGHEGLKFAFENLNIRFSTDKETTSIVAMQEKGNERVTAIKISTTFFLAKDEVIASGGMWYGYQTLPFVTLGTCVVDKYLVVFGKCTAQSNDLLWTTGNDIILRLELDNTTGIFYGWVVYSGTDLKFDLNYPLECIGNVESNIVKKVYFVDGINVPRAVNVVNKDAGQLANINLGYHLQLEDILSVEKVPTVIGNFPMGKVRFFYTYYNDEFSETNIVDWSPFFDCNYINQGGGPDSSYTTRFAFKVKISNVDTQFKFVRIYFQHFTSNDATTYQLKYIERPLNNQKSFETIVTFDQIDAKLSTTSYLDMKLANYSFIPYTVAEKNNRLFYGNIKKSLPDISDLDFAQYANIVFEDKEIGYEDLTLERTYQYQSDNTTFAGSNFDYMGFRKDNWYRFGIIAQYFTGEWSDVIFLKDVQCDRTSHTEIQYKTLSTTESQHNEIFKPNPQTVDGINGQLINWPSSKQPIASHYFIPQAKLIWQTGVEDLLNELYNRGFKRIKPVCVVPPVRYRNVITQGISCSTLYAGKERLNLSNNGLFAMPSYFFRPTPLYPLHHTLYNDYLYKPKYPYTLRKIGDLRLSKNIQTENGNWLANPQFTDERYAHYNASYREYRHGLSLPPKDRINAELQSSDFSMHDYFYTVAWNISKWYGQISPLFSNEDGVNLFSFIVNKNINNCYFKPYFDFDVADIHFDTQNGINQLCDIFNVLPYHDLHTTGYNNTLFVDETICTLNSPEVDYVYATQVAPVYRNRDIKTVGYAQVTSSMSDIDIPTTTYSSYVDGQCLFNIDPTQLNSETKEYINRICEHRGLDNQVMAWTCGPWWLDTLKVNNFIHYRNEDLWNNLTIVSWFSLITGLISPETWFPIFGAVVNAITTLDSNMFSGGSVLTQNDNFTINDETLYNLLTGDDIALDPHVQCIWFHRDIDMTLKNPKFTWATSFYGELDGKHAQKNSTKYYVKYRNNATYPYSPEGHQMFVFSEFPTKQNYQLTTGSSTTLSSTSLIRWATIPLTWNTVKLTKNDYTDSYWNNFISNRINLANTQLIYDGDVVLPNNQSGLGFIGDPAYSIRMNDFRGLFSYYFFPYYNDTLALAFYNNLDHQTGDALFSKYLVKHPWLLPVSKYHDWYTESNTVFNGMTNISECDVSTFHSNIIPYDEGSEYGCHYYAPFSTNFVGAYFEPYYAHVVYPFMNNDTSLPFCGTRLTYRKPNSRPSYNSTHSSLYSCCTNYVEPVNNNAKTYSAFYHSPQLTQLYLPEPDLSEVPFLKNSNVTLTKLYSFNCSDASLRPNVPVIEHQTETLTAAMKWYRGFKHLCSSESQVIEDNNELISTGWYLDKASIMGNLLFSGWMPQFFTKNGLLTGNAGEPNLNLKMALATTRKTETESYLSKLRTFLEVAKQSIDLNYQSCPHVVYCKQSNDALYLLDKFKVNANHINILNSDIDYYQFKPQFYYKEFMSDGGIHSNTNATIPASAQFAASWIYSTYPHSGHFEEFQFDELSRSNQPYWNHNNVLSAYPDLDHLHEDQLTIIIDDEESNLVCYDKYGYARTKDNYWVLPISNIYDNDLITRYDNKNPYTFENISVEQWNWKMCGPTCTIEDFLTNTHKWPDIKFQEGDTYFQRYNCLKTISNDTIVSVMNGEGAEDAYQGNDVTESASVMIESYLNLDGLYWEYQSIIDKDSSPLLHPFYQHINQINPVYNIQNDICDTFKQIDYNYYDAELEHYPTQIMWSLQKQDSERVDSWGIVPATNRILISGEMGSINKLISYRDNVYCLQDHGLSVLNYNEKVVEPTSTDGTLFVRLNDATKLQDVTYLSRTTGTLNKWSVVIGQRGFYWIDNTLKQFCSCGQNDGGFGIVDMSTKYGFKSWSNAHISSDNCVWNINVFLDQNRAFKANYDLQSGDIYWADGKYCICFNELLDCFTSFYNYETIPYKFNYLDQCYSVVNTKTTTSLWHDYSTYDHTLYNNKYVAYIDLLVNPIGQYDKVFNFIEYDVAAHNLQDLPIRYTSLNPYNMITVHNMYQKGQWALNKTNTKNKFNLWRSDIPREFIDGKQTMNRIRSPWCRIKLMLNPTQTNVFNPTDEQLYLDKLYYINVNYTVPEQPLKTNIRK